MSAVPVGGAASVVWTACVRLCFIDCILPSGGASLRLLVAPVCIAHPLAIAIVPSTPPSPDHTELFLRTCDPELRRVTVLLCSRLPPYSPLPPSALTALCPREGDCPHHSPGPAPLPRLSFCQRCYAHVGAGLAGQCWCETTKISRLVAFVSLCELNMFSSSHALQDTNQGWARCPATEIKSEYLTRIDRSHG
jgi:hypothetical protein